MNTLDKLCRTIIRVGRRKKDYRKGTKGEEMERISEREFAREYNKVYGEILCTEREKRQISRERLAKGIMSRLF